MGEKWGVQNKKTDQYGVCKTNTNTIHGSSTYLHVDLDEPVDEDGPHLGVDVGLVVHVLPGGVVGLGGVEVLEHVGHVRGDAEGVGPPGDVLRGQAGGEVGAVEGGTDESIFRWDDGVGVGR